MTTIGGKIPISRNFLLLTGSESEQERLGLNARAGGRAIQCQLVRGSSNKQQYSRNISLTDSIQPFSLHSTDRQLLSNDQSRLTLVFTSASTHNHMYHWDLGAITSPLPRRIQTAYLHYAPNPPYAPPTATATYAQQQCS